MQRLNTIGIVLSRIDYGEADRIVTFLTQDYGKLSGLVKGARKPKSRLAGGIELFSVSEISFINSTNELKPIVSAQLKQHFSNIVKDVNKTMWMYENLKLMQKTLPESCDAVYYQMLQTTLSELNDARLATWAVKLKFYADWLAAHGQQISTSHDAQNKPLEPSASFHFSVEDKAFTPSSGGLFDARHVKILRLASSYPTEKLLLVENGEEISTPLVKALQQTAIRVI